MNERPLAGSQARPSGRRESSVWIVAAAWLVVLLMIILLAWVGTQRFGITDSQSPPVVSLMPDLDTQPSAQVALPDYFDSSQTASINRLAGLHTTIPVRERNEVTTYVVEAGDSVMGIAKMHQIKPETVLWANYDLLQDNPNNLSIGQNLKIPAADGVLYQWKKSDNLDVIARKFKATVDDILVWPGNHIDIAEPYIPAGTLVMIPNGSRELIQWAIPTIWRANSGANKSINAGCDTSGSYAIGTGYFGWPADNHTLSGNDFWSGHLGIDIAAPTGANVYAADSGVVVYSAPISGGYGNMVMIDHGNGFTTVYAHNSQLVARCGQSVVKGQVIAYAGSTGNSTGAHLHFEIRYGGTFVNPWDYFS